MRTAVLLLLLALLVSAPSFFGGALAVETPECPFTRGFNLGGWFQVGSPQELSNAFTVTDLENMVALGADHVRVPIDLDNMSADAPSYAISPILFLYLDRLLDWAETLGLFVILDYHPQTIGLADDPQRQQRLIALWKQIAAHFNNRSDHVLYELHNEPYGLSDYEWGKLQGQIIDAIREIDTSHTLIVAPNAMSHFEYLAKLPQYADKNLIYSFHFYDPFQFTHQGTNWTDPSMEKLTGIPYPYDASRMPDMPAEFAGTWLGQGWGWYPDAGTQEALEGRMNIAVEFKDARQVPIHCGEFGVWVPGAPQTDRVQWYADIRSSLDAGGIAWTLWGYKGGFGIYKEDSPGHFPDDLDIPIVEALGLSVPGPLQTHPDTSGMVIYDDLVGNYFFDGGHSGTLNLYDSSDAADGDYCIDWSGVPQFGAIAWRFTNSRDLSQLRDEDYRIRFRIKTDSPGLSFDMRFLDTKMANAADHPWRIVKTIDSSLAPMDGEWHEVEFALSDMIDAGAWDNNTWYGPEGRFDWTRIDRFEIVAEHQAIQEKHLWLDNIQIVAPSVTDSSSPRANLLTNGNFSSGMANWDSYVNDSSGARAQFLVFAGALNAFILGAGADPWAVQLIQHGVPLLQGRTYEVKFTASADADRSINVALTRDGGSLDSYGGCTFSISREPALYRLTFTMSASTDLAARFVVGMGASDANLKLADLTLVEE